MQGFRLALVLRDSGGLLQFGADLFQRGAVDAAYLPGLFNHLSVLLHDLGIQTVGNRGRVIRIDQGVVVVFHFLPVNTLIEVHGGKGHDVSVRRGGTALRIELRGIDHVQQLIPFRVFSDRCDQGLEIRSGTFREKFVFSVMVVNPVGEEQPFRIDEELMEFFALPVAVIFVQDVLYQMSDRQVPLAILIPGDVATVVRGFREMVDVFLLPEGKVLPAGNLETHDLQVGEFIKQIFEVARLRAFLRGVATREESCNGS